MKKFYVSPCLKIAEIEIKENILLTGSDEPDQRIGDGEGGASKETKGMRLWDTEW